VTILAVFVSVSLSVASAQMLQPAAVTGLPYSADQVQEYTRTLEDGKSLTTSNVIGHFFRDSRGRTRTEAALKSSPAWRIEIFDPAAGVAYTLDDRNKVARRTEPQAKPPFRYAPLRATTDNLGTQVIEGVVAEGTRTSTAALTIETWDSVELKVNMLTKSSNGYSSKLVNLKREEPDPALFRPPADYKVIDQ